MAWIWVIAFGAIGVSIRFGIDTWIARYNFSFPVGTLFIIEESGNIRLFCGVAS